MNSQALELGIEQPKLRNAHAIANMNPLIYALFNSRALLCVILPLGPGPKKDYDASSQP